MQKKKKKKEWDGVTRGHSSSHLESVVVMVVDIGMQVGRGDAYWRLEYWVSLSGPQSEGRDKFRTSGVSFRRTHLVPSVWGTSRKKP